MVRMLSLPLLNTHLSFGHGMNVKFASAYIPIQTSTMVRMLLSVPVRVRTHLSFGHDMNVKFASAYIFR